MDFEKLSDKEIVDGLTSNNQKVIEYFFFKKCSKLFDYVLYSVFDNYADKRELINEFYLFLQENDWKKVNQFDYRSSLMTWTTVVAIRFFQKRRAKLIEKPSPEPPKPKGTLINPSTFIERRLDIKNALAKMDNERYKKVIIALDLNDVRPELLAQEMNIEIDNLYNIRRRAHLKLKAVMGRKEDYYD